MKNLIEKEIQSLKLNYPTSKSYIQRLQQMLDMETYTQKDYVSTGLMTPRKKYETKFPEVNLSERCTDVMSYVGGYYIEMLRNGRYFFEGRTITRIDWLEDDLYNKYISKNA